MDAGTSSSTMANVAATDGLSWAWYTDETVLELERQHIFHSAWQFAGFNTQIPEPGDFFTYTHIGRVGGLSVLVIRDKSGTVNAMVNSCRHRGTLVCAEASGNKKVLQCPYHAWTYGLDGYLRGAPRAKLNPEFNPDPEDTRLIPMRVYELGPMIFVNADPSAPSFEDTYGDWCLTPDGAPLDASLLTPATMVRDTWEAEIKCNWKLLVENTIECYHCPTVHPQFNEWTDPQKDMEFEFHDHFFYQQMVPKGADGVDHEKGIRGTQFWPNVQLHINQAARDGVAGGELAGTGDVVGIFVGVYLPIAHDRTLWRQWWVYTADADADTRQLTEWGVAASKEDQPVSENSQIGMSCGFEGKEQLMLPNSEPSLQWFQEHVQREVAP